ncbi:Tn3 family transposase [Spirosoma flavum]|uniref:Tn3 family transposase n=1 Tax=Spirosoma flavum TaxID=2048557 RepID=A0ABW6AL04_9BACT
MIVKRNESHTVSTYRELGYTITPVKRVDYEHLLSQWDDLLRLAVSIKLGYVKTSTILKRLNRTGGPVIRPPASVV